MTDLFLKIYKYLKVRRVLRWALLLVSFAVIGFGAFNIKLEENVANFLPRSEENEKINFVYQNSQIADKIVVRIYQPDSTTDVDRDMLIDASEYFVESVKELDGDDIKSVLYKVEQEKLLEISDFITKNLPYFMVEADYERLDSMLTNDAVLNTLQKDKDLLVSPMGMVLKSNIVNDPLHISASILKKLEKFKVSDSYETYNDYIFSKNGKELIVLISSVYQSSDTENNKKLLAAIGSSINKTKSEFKNAVDLGFFAAADVALTNASQIKNDSYLSITISLVLILILLWFYFKSFRSMFLIAMPVVFGALFSLAILAVVKGTISAIAIGAGSIIFGIAVNYSLHFIAHHKHSGSPLLVLKDLVSPLTVGSFTTVAAFLSLMFISAVSMRDFGLFAAFTLIGSILFVLIFLPHFVSAETVHPNHSNPNFFDRITEYRLEKNKILVAITIVGSFVLVFFSGRTGFNTNLQSINYMTKEQKAEFARLNKLTDLGEKTYYLVSEGKTLDEALANYEYVANGKLDSLVKCGDVTKVNGVGDLLPSSEIQKKKIERWNSFWSNKRDNLIQTFEKQSKSLGFKVGAFSNFYDVLKTDYTVQSQNYFDILTESFTKDYLIETPQRAMVVSLISLKEDNQEAGLASIESASDKSFVFDRASIAHKMVKSLSSDFNIVLYVSGLLVLVFLTISFGRFELSFIAFLPMFLSWIWILGIMAMFDIQFNIVNIILATFIFGLGDDYTIFMMDGLMGEYAYNKKMLSLHKNTIALSAITMFVGIGTLIFAKHPAMRSLAQVTIIGMASVIFITYIIPPLLFNCLTHKKGRKRLIPITIKNYAGTVYAFVAFLIGSLVLSIIGFCLLTIGRRTPKNKLRYHKTLRWTARYVVYRMPFVKTKVINEFNEKFDKPAIIVANHQSHIDLMFMMMLNPKLIILTNQWVWRSPFYGGIIRYADFYPVANGIENSIDRLKPMVELGYSIVIFPEGTRSETGYINRFHKGAFFLAEKLGLDILPVITHGIGFALPKSELMLRKSNVSVKILERISPSDNQYGVDYVERSKQIRKLFKAEYQKLCVENETPDYYSNLVIHNYVYKGASIEKEARITLKKHGNFASVINQLPDSGKVIVINCGIGVFPLMLALVKKGLQVEAYDESEENVALARNCRSVPENLNYTLELPFNIDQSKQLLTIDEMKIYVSE
ncbi:glycerol acyltransferase [Tenuifilaceae bacterium CYCD]|nr:glycerol acyltransferase [Tenuifilaceae bacterium CYCD]